MNSPFRHRRGGVYIAVLGTAMIISVLGITAITLQRIENRNAEASLDAAQARLNAHSAIRHGLLLIDDDADWRNTYTSGDWVTDMSTTTGTYTLQGIDPIDANLADDDNDPVTFVGIGKSNAMVQKVKVTLWPDEGPLSCLESSICAETDFDIHDSDIRADAPIEANHADVDTANIYADVDALTFAGSTYHGTSTTIDANKRREMPDWSTVFDTYATNGTSINIFNLPTETPNLLLNSDMEQGDGTTAEHWQPMTSPPDFGTCDVEQSTSQVLTGSYSIKVSNRDAWNVGPVQDVTRFLKPDTDYVVEAWIYHSALLAENFRFSVYAKGSGAGQFAVGGLDLLVSPNNWTKINATIHTPNWSGQLQSALIEIENVVSIIPMDFYVENWTMREADGGHYLFGAVLGPNHNPYPGGTNSQGLYVVDCGGQNLFIERSRIIGTLLVINPGSRSAVRQGPINWTAHVAGYPALLVKADVNNDANFTIAHTAQGLNESNLQTNFNPGGAGYGSLGEDFDTDDTYPSQIRGIIAAAGTVTLNNDPVVKGTIVAGVNVDTPSGAGADVRITHDATPLHVPPPGFTKKTQMRPQHAGYAKAVDP